MINLARKVSGTYDHRVWKTGLPVRSAVLKPHAGRLVVGWVTTSESRLLYVLFFFFLLASNESHFKSEKESITLIKHPLYCVLRVILEWSEAGRDATTAQIIPGQPYLDTSSFQEFNTEVLNGKASMSLWTQGVSRPAHRVAPYASILFKYCTGQTNVNTR